MNKYPLVTIVTPAYNQARYIKDTIESVLAQDYPNLEYIVLDDGSTDATADILEEYAEKLKFFRHENIGQANTINKGWSISSGEIVGYLSSDDLLLPNAVSSMVSLLESNKDCAVVYCDYDLIDDCGRKFREIKTEDYSKNRLLLDLFCQPGPGALIRKSFIERCGYWDSRYKQVPDFEFWTRVSALGLFIRQPLVLAQYRVHEDSASYRAISESRSDEIIKVVESKNFPIKDSSLRESYSSAYLISARHHLNSGRLYIGVLRLGKAILFRPVFIGKLIFWKTLASGLLRRFLHSKIKI